MRAATSLLAEALADEGFQVRQETRPVKVRVKGRVADLVGETIAGRTAGLSTKLAHIMTMVDSDPTVSAERIQEALRREGIEDAHVTKSADGRHTILRLRKLLSGTVHVLDPHDAVWQIVERHRDPATGRMGPAEDDSLRRDLEALLLRKGYDLEVRRLEVVRVLVLKLRPPAGESAPERPTK